MLVDRCAGTGSPAIDLFFDGGVFGIEAPTGELDRRPRRVPGRLRRGRPLLRRRRRRVLQLPGPDDRRTDEARHLRARRHHEQRVRRGRRLHRAAASSARPPRHPTWREPPPSCSSANPGLDVAELQQLLEDRALDAGAAGHDNMLRRRAPPPRRHRRRAPRRPQAFTGMDPTRLLRQPPRHRSTPARAPNRTTPLGAKRQAAACRSAASPASLTTPPPSSLNVTAVDPTAAGLPHGATPAARVPNASNVNFATGQTVAVHVTATVGADDKVELFNAAGNTHLHRRPRRLVRAHRRAAAPAPTGSHRSPAPAARWTPAPAPLGLRRGRGRAAAPHRSARAGDARPCRSPGWAASPPTPPPS